MILYDKEKIQSINAEKFLHLLIAFVYSRPAQTPIEDVIEFIEETMDRDFKDRLDPAYREDTIKLAAARNNVLGNSRA